MTMLEAVLLDLDGTLVDTREIIHGSVTHSVFTHTKLSIPEGLLDRHMGKTLNGTFADVLHELKFGVCPNDLMEQLIDELTRYQLANFHLYKPFPGTLQGLQEIKERDYKIGIVTSRTNAKQVLEFAGLANFIDEYVIPPDTVKHKPHPEPVLLAMRRLVVTEPRKAIMVGDTDKDILAGKAAGTPTVGFTYGHDGAAIATHKPDYLADSFLELPGIVFNHNPD